MTTIVIIALDYREVKGRQKCNINNYQDVVFKSKNHNIVQISPPSMCHLSGANFRKANLSYANFHLADLRGADLREANLSHTNLTLPTLALPIFVKLTSKKPILTSPLCITPT